MLPAWAASNDSLNLQNWHGMLSSMRTDQPTSGYDKYFTSVRLGNVSLRVGPVWSGSMNAWVGLVES